MKISIGEKIVPKPVARTNDVDNVWGPGWHAERRAGKIVARYQTAGHATPDNEVEITEAEFAALRADPDALDRILQAHGQ